VQAWWQARYLDDVAKAERSGGGADESAFAPRVLLDARARVFQCLWGAQDHLARDEERGLWRNKITGCVPFAAPLTPTTARV
jgi:hypothetical protein